MVLSWKEKDKKLMEGIEQLKEVAQAYGLQMTDTEQQDHDWNDPIEEENEVKITKEYVIIFMNREPLTITADSFEFNSDDNLYYFYDEDGDEIAAFDKAFVVGISLTVGSTIQNFGVSALVPALPAPQDRRTL